jgi:hypothetical protein
MNDDYWCWWLMTPEYLLCGMLTIIICFLLILHFVFCHMLLNTILTLHVTAYTISFFFGDWFFLELRACAYICTEECFAPVEAGNCTERQVRWYYNSTECTPFWYTGCGGNGNNFKTRVLCQKSCPSRQVRVGKCCMLLMYSNQLGRPFLTEIFKASVVLPSRFPSKSTAMMSSASRPTIASHQTP